MKNLTAFYFLTGLCFGEGDILYAVGATLILLLYTFVLWLVLAGFQAVVMLVIGILMKGLRI